VHVEPWPDGRRVRVHVNITPFEKRPNVDLSILNDRDEVISDAIIIETMIPKLVITMHLRNPEVDGKYHLKATLYYPDMDPVDLFDQPFEIHLEPPAE
jgi:hypothetical protein